MPKVYSIDGITPVVHADAYVHPSAVLHGCVVQRDALIGINAVVNDNAVVGESAFVAAMAFVKAEFVVPARTLVAGIPAKVLRELREAEIAWKRDATRQYQELAARSLASMRQTEALAAAEPGRKRFTAEDVLPLSVMKAREGKP